MTCPGLLRLKAGELYLFSDREQGCIWGLYDGTDAEGHVRLEVASCDFKHFSRYITLRETYGDCRLATRDELRDFSFNMGWRRI